MQAEDLRTNLALNGPRWFLKAAQAADLGRDPSSGGAAQAADLGRDPSSGGCGLMLGPDLKLMTGLNIDLKPTPLALKPLDFLP